MPAPGMAGPRTTPSCFLLASVLVLVGHTSRSLTTKLVNCEPRQCGVHLVSILRPDWKTAPESHKRFWWWKLDVMGLAMTEKDYLQHRFSEAVVALRPDVVQEAVVISNCKRIEVLVAADRSAPASEVERVVADMLEGRATAWEREMNTTASTGDGLSVSDFIATVSGAEAAARYLCRVAAGIPPGSPPHAFSPHSSRDAHVLRQLKQAFAAASAGGPGAARPPCGARLGAMLRGCLGAGKAARDPGAVPEIRALSPSRRPSRDERARGAEAALRRAVEPAVVRCVEAVEAIDRGRVVAAFRDRARAVAAQRDPAAAKGRPLSLVVRRELHAPTLALRSGESIDEAAVMDRVASAAAAGAQREAA